MYPKILRSWYRYPWLAIPALIWFGLLVVFANTLRGQLTGEVGLLRVDVNFLGLVSAALVLIVIRVSRITIRLLSFPYNLSEIVYGFNPVVIDFIGLVWFSALLPFCFGLVYWHYGLINASGSLVKDGATAMYFSFITWTTLGYGDVTPLSSGRVFTAVEAFLGYLFLGILIAAVIRTANALAAPFIQRDWAEIEKWVEKAERDWKEDENSLTESKNSNVHDDSPKRGLKPRRRWWPFGKKGC